MITADGVVAGFSSCSRTYRVITWTTATAGTARNAPTMPNSVPPRATTDQYTAAWIFIVRPTRIGCITLPSSCCTTSTIASTPTAVQTPLETSATRMATGAGDEGADDRHEPAEERQHRDRQRERHARASTPPAR